MKTILRSIYHFLALVINLYYLNELKNYPLKLPEFPFYQKFFYLTNINQMLIVYFYINVIKIDIINLVIWTRKDDNSKAAL
jgi:hypothetical protein